MKIAVYCSAKDAIPEEYLALGDALGTWIGENGHTLVYGGATGGLMSRTSNATKAAGGQVVGVIPRRIIACGRKADNCDDLIEVANIDSDFIGMSCAGALMSDALEPGFVICNLPCFLGIIAKEIAVFGNRTNLFQLAEYFKLFHENTSHISLCPLQRVNRIIRVGYEKCDKPGVNVADSQFINRKFSQKRKQVIITL